MQPQPYFTIAASVDCVIFGFDSTTGLKVLLVNRGNYEPYENMWALPGDLVHPEEDLDDAAKRVLMELTGLEKVYLEQVRTFGNPNRHPLGRVLTVAYFSLIRSDEYNVLVSSWAKDAEWVNVRELPALAFDHKDILAACLRRLQRRVRARPVGFELLPDKFSLSDLQYLYESILGVKMDKRNFRKKILAMNFLLPLAEAQNGVAHRPAKLYAFDQKNYRRLVDEGFTFTI